jgi:hypothetical protein
MAPQSSASPRDAAGVPGEAPARVTAVGRLLLAPLVRSTVEQATTPYEEALA